MASSQFVGLYLYNSPEFVLAWMGLLSIGAAPALINYNLASDALVHCVKISGAKFLIYDAAPDCVARMEGVDDKLKDLGVEAIRLSQDLKDKVAQYPAHRPQADCFKNSKKMLPFALMYTR